MQLKAAMELAGQKPTHNVLNPEHNYAPTGGWARHHDAGRWWDAMLRLEAATDFPLQPTRKGRCCRTWRSFSP